MTVLPETQDRALAALRRLPTTSGTGQPPSVRAQAVFGRAPTGLALPLNRKTTQQAITTLPLTDLEPRQEAITAQGLEAYIARPRRDPPDVARVQMRDGKTRLLVQEGHTRLGAAVLRGDAEMPMRVWDFTQGETGSFDPVSRGRHRIGEGQRDKSINLPDVADVSFPSLIGAVPARPPKKKRRSVKYQGVTLSRAPLQFEVQVLSLTEIPLRLDAAVLALQEQQSLAQILHDVAQYGSQQALLELVRQGAPDTIQHTLPDTTDAVRGLVARVEADRLMDLATAFHAATIKLGRRPIKERRRAALARSLSDRSAPGIIKRHHAQAVNKAFSLGRAAVVDQYRRPRGPISLASKHDKLVSGAMWVDAVIQTAIMDTSTCDECEAVDGEQMELGDDRQEELHPPYVMCLGGDRCRCVQIALLSDGSEIDVDEVPDEAYDTEAF
jgi:hypothetical protein